MRWTTTKNSWQMNDYAIVDNDGKEIGIKIVARANLSVPVEYQVYINHRYDSTFSNLSDAKARADIAALDLSNQ